MTDAEFTELVRRMRTLQKQYFRGRNVLVLEESKKAEAAVDAELKRREAGPNLFEQGGADGAK